MAQNQPKNPEKHSTFIPKEKKSTKPFHKTPMLDQLESGPWPSFVTGLKRLAHDNNMMVDLLGQLEHSYTTRKGYWKGGTVSVFGYGGGIIPRFTELMGSDGKAMFPEAKEFHTLRVQPPAGNHYTTKMLRQLSDSWKKWGSGLIAFHGQTGNIMFIGSTSENTQHFFDEINEYGFDLGGAGPCVRTAMSCVGAARCEQSCANEQKIHRTLVNNFIDDMHRPALPYKFKFKVSGCPNDCKLDPARRLRRHRHLARRHEGRPEGNQGLHQGQEPQVCYRQRREPLPDQGAVAERRRHPGRG